MLLPTLVLGMMLPANGVAQEGPSSILSQIAGEWRGVGALRAASGSLPERVDCSLRIQWTQDSGRLKQALSCENGSNRFSAQGDLMLLETHPLLSGFISLSDQAGGTFAHCEFKGRTLYITMVSRRQGGGDRQLINPAGTSLWILMLNRGDRRLGTVIRRYDRSGRAYQALSINLARRSAHMPEKTVAARVNAPSWQAIVEPIPPLDRQLVEPPISR